MDAIALAGPAVEPISLAEMKAFLRLDTADEDDLVGALVRAARLAVERDTRLLLVGQTWRVTLDRWPGDRIVRLPLAPVSSVSALRAVPDAGSAIFVDPSLYALRGASEAPRLVVDGSAPDAPPQGRIEIDLVCGFGAASTSVPEPLRMAVRLLAADWFANRGDDPESGGGASAVTVAALLAPFRRPRVA